MITFKDPWVLIFIPFVLGLVIVIRRRQREVSFSVPSRELFSSLGVSWRVRFQNIPYLLRLLILVLFLIALAGPRTILKNSLTQTEGIDIVLSIDISGSMAAEDFKINNQRLNRLEIVKRVVHEFIEARSSDRIGLVAFAALAYTVCPLTTDSAWLAENLNRVELGLIKDGTAIGSGITSSLTRLKNSGAKSKVIILLTDGINNAGKIEPLSAARAAQALGVKIYTIGAGTKGPVPFPVEDFFGRRVYQNVLFELDEETLKEIAKVTGGKYFRATDAESLRQIYKEIDVLEKTKIQKVGFKEYSELFDKVLMAALILLVIEVVLKNTLFLKIP